MFMGAACFKTFSSEAKSVSGMPAFLTDKNNPVGYCVQGAIELPGKNHEVLLHKSLVLVLPFLVICFYFGPYQKAFLGNVFNKFATLFEQIQVFVHSVLKTHES